MSLTRTSLSAAITANQLKGLPITSTAAGFPAVGQVGTKQVVQIDGEYMLLDKVVASGVIDVLLRGWNGTKAIAHDVLAPVMTSSAPGDFPGDPVGAVDSRPPNVDLQIAVGQNGAIPVPIQNTTALLTKATALATTTLAAPNKGSDGVRLTLTSMTAAAHVITATGLINDGAAGAPHTTLTFAAFAGASITLEAAAGLWNVVANNGVTVT